MYGARILHSARIEYSQTNMLPTEPKRARLVQIVDAAAADAYQRGGAHLVCHPGCSQCCIGVFPIAHEDAARLREGLALLEQTDPAKAARIHERVAQSLTRLDPWFPGDLTTGILNDNHEAAILFEEFAN